MVLAALICIALGVGLIVLCILVPSEGTPSEKEGVSSVDNSSGSNINKQNSSEENAFEGNNTELGEKNPSEVNDPPVSEPEENISPSEPEEIPEPEDIPEDVVEPIEPETPKNSAKDDPLLVLANVDNPLPEDFEVGELEKVQGNYYLDVRAASYARQMIADAKKDGITLQLCSSYRSKDLQQTLFTNKYNYYISNGWEKEAAYAKTSTIIAIPGTSEHQTGLCMDVVTPSYQVLDAGYAETDAAKWLAENAYDYGFILRYPKDKQEITKIIFEPWHYRFVGIENAKLIKDSGLCLEEYLETLE